MDTLAEVVLFFENVLFRAPIQIVQNIIKAFKEPYNPEGNDENVEDRNSDQ